MAAAVESNWLKKYYGKWYDKLNPTTAIDGKYFAVVRVTQVGKAGYVLVRKNGTHGVTPYSILFEGVPNAEQFKLMRDALDRADAK